MLKLIQVYSILAFQIFLAFSMAQAQVTWAESAQHQETSSTEEASKTSTAKEALAPPAYLQGLLRTIADQEIDLVERRRAFMDLAVNLDRLVGKDPKKQASISACAAFAFLLEQLQILNNGATEKSLLDATIIFADTRSYYRNLSNGALLLRGPYAPLREELTWHLSLGINVHVGTKTRYTLSDLRNMEKNGLLNGSYAARGQRRYVQTQDKNFQLPQWMSTHGGKGLAGGQGRAHGYKQKPGDSDTSGRHDHFLANFLIGYLSEKRGHSKLNQVVREGAPILVEKFSPNQNDSPTDAEINFLGQHFGSLISKRPNRSTRANELNFLAYDSVCDESSAKIAIQGPLTEKKLQAAFDAVYQKQSF